MIQFTGIPDLILGIQLVLLITTVVFLIYPVIKYSRNVAYTEGIVAFTLALMCVIFVSINIQITEDMLVASVFRVLGSMFAFIGSWYFARDFINLGKGTPLESYLSSQGDSEDE